MQRLDRIGLLAKVQWILGVSGGSYIASSRALVAHNLPTGTRPHAYAPGTAEELNLRYNTHYIAPNAATVLVGVLSLLLGAMVTFVVALAPLYALAHAWGWLLRWQDVLVPSGPAVAPAAVTGLGWWLPPVIVAAITLALFGFWWLTLAPVAGRAGTRTRLLGSLRPDGPDRGANRAAWVGGAAAVTAGLAIAMLVVPPLISWLTRAAGSLGTITHFLGFGGKPSWSHAMVRGGRGLAPGQVVHPWAHGRFRRPQPVPGLPAEGDIWVCKLGWWAGAPWDVVAYAKSHSTFPGDSTLEQLYDAPEFEAYQQLGTATVRDATRHCEPRLKWAPPTAAVPLSPAASRLAAQGRSR